MFKTRPRGGGRDVPQPTSLPLFGDDQWIGTLLVMNTPNQLSREAIDEFKAIYADEFGEVLSDAEVQEMAVRLLRFFGVLKEPPAA